jgi:hypothetical protein
MSDEWAAYQKRNEYLEAVFDGMGASDAIHQTLIEKGNFQSLEGDARFWFIYLRVVRYLAQYDDHYVNVDFQDPELVGAVLHEEDLPALDPEALYELRVQAQALESAWNAGETYGLTLWEAVSLQYPADETPTEVQYYWRVKQRLSWLRKRFEGREDVEEYVLEPDTPGGAIGVT